MAISELEWAVGEFASSRRLKGYRKYQQYYDGDQPLAYATRKYRSQFWRLFRGFSDNMCQSVVDVQAERLEVIGFTSSSATVEEETYNSQGEKVAKPAAATPPAPTSPLDPNAPPAPLPEKTITVSVVHDDVGDNAWGEWEDESMPLVADQIHADVFLFGDGFALADEEGVWRQEPSEIAVRYSREKPGVLEAAAKCWTEMDGTVYLNIYTPDGLEKYACKKDKANSKLQAADFEVIEGGGALPQGIPIVHFANKAYGRYGISELKNVIPLQDALNKAEMDLMLAMEYQSFRQRWITGVDVELGDDGLPKNFSGEHGPGNFLAFPDADAKVGEFAMADLTPYVKVVENYRGQIARVSGIPLHYFFVGEGAGATQSGESLKVGESRFTRKGNRQMRCLGKGWENLMDLVLEIVSTQDDNITYDSAVDLNVVWDEVSPRSESEELDVLVKKGTIGVPNSQLQKEAGYDPDEIRQFTIEYAENIKLGLQAAPSMNPQGQVQVPKGETSANATSHTSAAAATAPPAGN
jgi:hypothetical protein